MVIVNTKRCARCRVPRLHREFRSAAVGSRAKDGKHPYCKACCRQYQRDNPRESNPEYHAKWHQDHKAQQLQVVKDGVKRLRLQIMDMYGHACSCCGESHYNFLTLEHILGGGNRHRKGRAPYTVYKEILAEGYRPDKYTILCYNCNCSRGVYGYCCRTPEESCSVSAFIPLKKIRK